MPFTLEQFVKIRPYAWHLTAASNLPLIERDRRLLCAETLAASTPTAVNELRSAVIPVRNDGATVMLRDQKPLRPSAVIFDGGWTLDDLRRAVNRHVFFWPGKADGPMQHGRNHFACYANAGDVALRMPMATLLALNAEPKFCPFNSGAPAARARSRRGPDTFTTADRFGRSAAGVVELVFEGTAHLPDFDVFTADRWPPARA
ncbi:MAG: hypothetical protein AAF743_01540 [Planctomycetota bacterium]